MTGERILIVDDSAKVRDFLAKTVLSMEGYIIDTARDGVEGLALALANIPDLIITDLSMPEMNGLEMVEELRRAGHQIPVILTTGEGSEQIAVRALRAGVMDYFVKPFNESELREAVKRILQATRVGAVRAGIPDQRRLQALNTLIAIGKSVTSLLDLEMILSRVVEAAVYLSGAEEGTLMLVDPDTSELYMRVAKNVEEGLRSMRLPVEDSLVGRVVQTGEPLLIGGQGMQKIKTRYLVRSLLYVPLKVRDRVIGVLGLHNRMSDHPVSNQDVSLIKALADYAAIAIVNAQQYTEAETERARLRRILQQLREPFLLVDQVGRLALCNLPAWELLIPPEVGDPIGRYFSDVVENSSLLELLTSSNEAHGNVEFEDGRTFYACVSPIEGVGQAIIMQDITHLKKLDQLKSEAITTISHDIRSPLTAVLSYIELIKRSGELNEQQIDLVEHAKLSVQAITSLINDLLEMSKLEAGLDRQREAVSLAQLARYAVEAISGKAEMKRQNLIVELTEEDTTVLGNPNRLRRAFLNLLDNAVKYTPEGGNVEISVFREADQVVSCITDTGIGIPPEDLPRIFDRYYRVAEVEKTHEGTGLGLSIVKTIIEEHGGRVWVDSYPGEGTTFTLVLPSHISLSDNGGRPASG